MQPDRLARRPGLYLVEDGMVSVFEGGLKAVSELVDRLDAQALL